MAVIGGNAHLKMETQKGPFSSVTEQGMLLEQGSSFIIHMNYLTYLSGNILQTSCPSTFSLFPYLFLSQPLPQGKSQHSMYSLKSHRFLHLGPYGLRNIFWCQTALLNVPFLCLISRYIEYLSRYRNAGKCVTCAVRYQLHLCMYTFINLIDVLQHNWERLPNLPIKQWFSTFFVP